MSEFVTMAWLAAYGVLGGVILLGTLYAFLISVKEIKGALGWLFASISLINIGIIIHTGAILEFGNDTEQITQFVVSHLMLMTGFIVLIVTGKNLLEVGGRIGFGK